MARPTRNVRAGGDTGTPTDFPQTTPDRPAYSHHDHSFTLQAIHELGHNFSSFKGSIETDLRHLTDASKDSKKSLDDLTAKANTIRGIIIAVIAMVPLSLGAVGYLVWNYVLKEPLEWATKQSNIESVKKDIAQQPPPNSSNDQTSQTKK